MVFLFMLGFRLALQFLHLFTYLGCLAVLEFL